jgi:carbon monoxide dehydrogenase subunit G
LLTKIVAQEFQQSFQVDAKPAEVWSFFWDVEAVARCLPGCHKVIEQEAGRRYTAHVRKAVGPFALGMELQITVLESEAPKWLCVKINGDDSRLRSTVNQKLTVGLRVLDDQQTEVELVGQFTLEGLLASLSKHLISAQINRIIEDFAAALRAAILAGR